MTDEPTLHKTGVTLKMKVQRFDWDETMKEVDIGAERTPFLVGQQGWACSLCDKGPMDSHNFKSHVNSARHKLKLYASKVSFEKELLTKASDGLSWYCRPCKTGIMNTHNATTHINSERHRQLIKPACFIRQSNDGSSWVCQLCNAGPMTDKDTRIHAESSRHTKKISSRVIDCEPLGAIVDTSSDKFRSREENIRVSIRCNSMDCVSLHCKSSDEGTMRIEATFVKRGPPKKQHSLRPRF